MRHAVTTVGLALALCLPGALGAQVRGSERAEVSQTVDGTKVTVNYARPRLRGRSNVFGTVVPWGEIWTPGANTATKLTVSKDVTIEGHAVPQGSYSVWIPVTEGEWTLVLDRDTTLFHMHGPKERAGQIRFAVRKVPVPPTDVLTWSFPELRATSLRLVMQWETTSVPLDIAVTPTQPVEVAPEVGRRVEGRYDLRFKPAPPPTDTTVTQPEPMPERFTFTLRQDGRMLRAHAEPPFWPGAEDFVLVRKSDNLFMVAEMDREGLRELWDWGVLEFALTKDRATGFDIRTANDEVVASATRLR
jgi:hypothetical protein